ncbi:MAG: ABC transporter substrate-binding protein [Trueperaceae bacterium]|nr:ABC transporter substrate-binding protein [Trueperaceae bacterium]
MSQLVLGLARALCVLLPVALGLASAQDAPPPSHGGEVVVAIAADPPGWDPTVSTSQEIPRVVYHNVFEGLVRFDRNGEIVPALAESWTLSGDALSLTFHVRRGVRFHDGRPLTLNDIVAKFDRARDPDSGHTNAAYYETIDALVVDEEAHTVTFLLSRPTRSLLYDLARPDSVVYPAGTETSQRGRPVGTGPFRFVEYREGSEVRLERFEDYYLDGVPYLDAVRFRIIGDPNTRYAALRAGDVDLIGTSLAPEQFLQARQDPSLVATEGTATTEITLAMNNARAPFDDVRVRQAITHAIDKRAIVEGAMFGLGTVIGTHMSPAEPYYLDLTDTYPYDPDRARELLAEAGYPDGFDVAFELPEPYALERRSGQVIAQQLAEVGIDVELSVVEWGTWIQRIFLGADYDMTIIGHSEPRDIDVYADPEYYFQYENPRVATLVTEAESASTREAEIAAYREIARIIADDAVAVWVFSPPYLVAAREDVHGFWTDQPTPAIDMTEVHRGP